MAVSLPFLTRSQGAHVRSLLLDKRIRTRDGAFVVEGAHSVRDLVARYPEAILRIVCAHSYLSKDMRRDGLVRSASSIPQYSCSDRQFSKLTDLDTPQGILAVVRKPKWDEAKVLSQSSVLGVFGEELQDPANVGAIIRTAAALNVSALWLTPESADVFQPKVVRAASGVLLAMPIFSAKDVSGLIRQGCQVFAAEANSGKAVSIDEFHHAPRKLVLAVGNESRGLSTQIRRQATTRFTIPLSRGVESLNVAATAAIATYYFSRLPKGE